MKGVTLLKYILAAATAATLTTPAYARDNSSYAGVEGGVLFPKNTIVDVDIAIEGDSVGQTFGIDNKTGWDLDLVGGHDFGLFRVEAELGWKRTKHDDYTVSFDEDIGAEEGTFGANGRTTVVSLMGNALLDAGSEDGFSFYGGGGLGWARTAIRVDQDELVEDTQTVKDSHLAWQLIAGGRAAITSQLDLGLKYRYFATKLSDHLSEEDVEIDVSTKFRSHSVLVSLIYNFRAPEAALPSAQPQPTVESALPPPLPPEEVEAPDTPSHTHAAGERGR
jgi:opacity protein-like surface antigen